MMSSWMPCFHYKWTRTSPLEATSNRPCLSGTLVVQLIVALALLMLNFTSGPTARSGTVAGEIRANAAAVPDGRMYRI